MRTVAASLGLANASYSVRGTAPRASRASSPTCVTDVLPLVSAGEDHPQSGRAALM